MTWVWLPRASNGTLVPVNIGQASHMDPGTSSWPTYLAGNIDRNRVFAGLANRAGAAPPITRILGRNWNAGSAPGENRARSSRPQCRPNTRGFAAHVGATAGGADRAVTRVTQQ